MGFPGGSGVKNLPANSGHTRVVGSIPTSRRCLGEGMEMYSSILDPWTKESGGVQSTGLQSDMTELLSMQ